MTILALVYGILFRPPEQLTAKTGRLFVTATVRVKDGDGSQFVRVVAFSETVQADLMRLSDGDAVSVQGPLKCELYTPDGGDPRISLSIVADQVLALRKAKTAGEWQSPADGLSRFEAPR